jgi:large subunit ribosomal protein L18e
MGIDIVAGGRRVGHKTRTSPKSDNVYLGLLSKLYKFLARRTDSPFVAAVLQRLFMSKVNRPPLGLGRLSKLMINKEDKIAVIVGTITDDNRLLEVPKLTGMMQADQQCVLHFAMQHRIIALQAKF